MSDPRFSAKLGIVAAIVLAGCARHPSSGVASGAGRGAAGAEQITAASDDASPSSHDLADDTALADAGAPPTGTDWVELVRMQRWNDAWQKLELLSDEDKATPALRLVRARVAGERGDAATAVKLLDGLEKDLPSLEDDISRLRAEAQLSAGPYEPAARYFAHKEGTKSMARAAIAFDKAGLSAEARAAADRFLANAKGDRDEATVRAIRARLSEALGQVAPAADDARWIVVHAPDSEHAADFEAALARLDAAHPLTGRERLTRADRLADTGHLDDALAELDRVMGSPSPPPAIDVDFARAQMLYRSRGRYADAATAYDKIAAVKGSREAEALFFAARARSRADKDDDARRGYAAIVRRFPSSTWAEQAGYLSARLSFIHGAWAEAAAEYREYLKHFAQGKDRDAARYERAIALLAAGESKTARIELHALVDGAQGQDLARLRELEGLAAVRAGDKAKGTELLTEVARSQPLSFGALSARARLAALGAEVPPVIEGAETSQGTATTSPSPAPLSLRLPAGADFYHRLGLDSEAEGYLRARESLATTQAPGREKEALCDLYGQIERAGRAYRVALDAVRGATLDHAPTAATRWGWDCLYPHPYATLVRDLEQRENLPRGIVYAVMRQESAYDPGAVSPARAVGLLQLMPDTAEKVAKSAGISFDPAILKSPPFNLDLGARYIAKVLDDFGGAVSLAAAAYNAGPQAVKRWVKRARDLDVDVWVATIPYEETRAYVPRVVANLARYQLLGGGPAAVSPFELALPKKVTVADGDF